MERLIFHVDVNSAFLSWEAVRRVKAGGADIRLIPSCISGDPDKRTSVVLAKSIPAKRFNIKTGEPISMALRKCPELYIAKPDFTLYRKYSKAFKDICRDYAPVVEEFSIDECFLDMTGTELIYPDPIATAYEIKNKIRDTLGFTVNVGVGSNKLLAKMASDFEKPDKVHTLFDYEIEKKLWPLPVTDLLMLGKSAADKLGRMRIKTIGELANMNLKDTQRVLGVKLGELLHSYANGIDNSEVSDEPEAAKGFGISTTLNENVTTVERANKILLNLADSVSSRMRRDNAKAMCVSVKIRTNEFKNRSHQTVLFEPTDVTSEIYEEAKRLFIELWDKRSPLRLIGISLSKIVFNENEQLSLIVDEKHEKHKKIDKAVDAIRGKFGKASVMRGTIVGENLKGKD
ncbi:MAG: DNA polymerase IV [Oscillospiraceae bacterium]|nr:DNA polymerase IV [Oscillospiraceae bacterium]